MSREIPLTKGKVALVDDDCADWLLQWNWNYSQGYASRGVASGVKAGAGHVAMHRVVAGAATGEVVDHINGDKLDNRRANLRVCIQAENARNRRGWLNGKSRFKGVTFDRERGSWVADVMVNRRHVFVGRFADELEAALAYDAAARVAHGAFARLNLPDRWAPLAGTVTERIARALTGAATPKRAALSDSARADILARAARGEDYRWIAADHDISRSAAAGLVFRAYAATRNRT